MDLIWEKFTEWLKELLVGGIMDNLTGLFDNVNAKVAEAAGHIGSTPQAWNANIYSMIRSLSDNLILPIAGVILAFVMTLELIQLIADRNNLHDIDTWVFFRWVFKTAAAVLIVSNTWNIVMGVFEAAQSVVNRASGLIVGNTSINLADHIADLEARLLEMNVWTLLGLWLQSFVVGFTMWALTICIFIIIYGRMIEIYLVTSIAPIPMATMMGKEWGGMGQNYLRSLLALAFQGFLIIICIAIYAVLVQNMLIDDNIMKERPLHRYNQETGRKQIIATMACESARRQSVYLKIGCNAYHKRDPTSQPMSFWTEQDVLAYGGGVRHHLPAKA